MLTLGGNRREDEKERAMCQNLREGGGGEAAVAEDAIGQPWVIYADCGFERSEQRVQRSTKVAVSDESDVRVAQQDRVNVARGDVSLSSLPEGSILAADPTREIDGQTQRVLGDGLCISGSAAQHMDSADEACRLFEPDHWAPRCFVGSTFEEAHDRVTTLRSKGVVDYFGVCDALDPPPRIGDTVVCPLLLPQPFMNRAYVAAVSGISRRKPKQEGLFDSATNELDADFSPVARAATRMKGERVAGSYIRPPPSGTTTGTSPSG